MSDWDSEDEQAEIKAELKVVLAELVVAQRDLGEARSNFTGSQQQLAAEEARRIRLESDAAALRAENHRLRAELDEERLMSKRVIPELVSERDAAYAMLNRFKARYNALPTIPTKEQWAAVCVETMSDVEGWPRDD